jgi:hypothetical protein
MKNTIKLIGIIALAAAIGLSMAACGDGAGGGGGPAQETPYEFKGYADYGDDIIIAISRTAPRAITPQSGDYYVVRVKGAVKTSGRITINGSVWTFTPGTGSPFQGIFDNKFQILIVDYIPEVGYAVLQPPGGGTTFTGGPDPALNGIWIGAEVFPDYTDGKAIVFKGGEFMLFDAGIGIGTYSVSGNKLTLTPTQKWNYGTGTWETITMAPSTVDYTVTATTLTYTFKSGGQDARGEYKKMP